MAGMTPFKAFNVVRFGVKGTAMVPFTGLDEKAALGARLLPLHAAPASL